MEFVEKIQAAAGSIRAKASSILENKPSAIGCILGSGLGELADQLKDAVILPYNEIPHFPVSTVEGHAGKLVIGTLMNQTVIAMKGRFHFYEGYSMREVTFPVRVMKALGVDTLLITNAAGGVNTDFQAGDLMIITDHLNLTFTNPLIGKNDLELGPRFPDLSQAYHPELIALAQAAGRKSRISLKQGVYAYFTGPNYETPAEIKMARILGGDAVGMSTVSEVMAAVHSQMKVLGISCISNMAAGILDQPLHHDEVIETTQKVKADFIQLVKNILAML